MEAKDEYRKHGLLPNRAGQQRLREIKLQEQIDDLITKNKELEGELGLKQIELSDLKGHAAGKVCGLCNYLERSACYEQREAAEQQVKELHELLEAKNRLLVCYRVGTRRGIDKILDDISRLEALTNTEKKT